MKFLKFSIVILFLLSLSSAVVSLYLSNIRENEKEKRIYLEGLKSELEAQVESLETEKGQLVSENSDLKEKLAQEKDGRQKVLSLLNQKEIQIKTIQEEARHAELSFKTAQKRNEELERILDDLEKRMSQIESQAEMPGTEVGYLEINPVTENAAEAPKVETPPEITFKPVTQLPEPPKKRRLFPFFKKSAPKPEAPTESEAKTPEPIASVPPAPEPVKAVPVTVEAGPKTKQTIAAGSVLLINRNYNFVVINLGSKQSLNIDDIVSIQQKGNEIAKARVEKVYDDYSAAYITEEQSDHPIAEGDAVARI